MSHLMLLSFFPAYILSWLQATKWVAWFKYELSIPPSTTLVVPLRQQERLIKKTITHSEWVDAERRCQNLGWTISELKVKAK